MNICENCKTKHDGKYGSGRFCSIKCARGFSTKAKRQKINEKVSKKLKKPKKLKYCTSCNIQISNTKSKYCIACKKYCQNVELFKKLNIYNENKSLKELGEIALNILIELYFNKQYSKPMIKKECGIGSNTIYGFLKKHNISLRTVQHAQQLAVLENRSAISHISSNKYKHGGHITGENKQIYYRSSYELRYAKYLDNKQIPYEVEFKRFLYYDTQCKKYRVAIPDFYLPLENKIVEIKSIGTLNEQNMNDKKKIYLQNGFKFKLYIGDEIPSI